MGSLSSGAIAGLGWAGRGWAGRGLAAGSTARLSPTAFPLLLEPLPCPLQMCATLSCRS